MKILITGGLGFIGSNLATELSKSNHKIIILDNLDPNYGGNRFNIFDSKRKNINVIEDSVLNNKLLKELVKDSDIVIHTAAQVSYIDSFNENLRIVYSKIFYEKLQFSFFLKREKLRTFCPVSPSFFIIL